MNRSTYLALFGILGSCPSPNPQPSCAGNSAVPSELGGLTVFSQVHAEPQGSMYSCIVYTLAL